MATVAGIKWSTIATWASRIVLCLIFVAVGAEKLTGTGNTIDYFAAIGWGQWFRYLTGTFDVVGAALLLVPRLTWSGATLIAFNAGLATLISATVLQGNPTWGSPVMVFVPLVLALCAAGLAWVTRPRRVKPSRIG